LLSDSNETEEAPEAARNGLELIGDPPFNVRPCGKVLFELRDICRHFGDGYGGKDEGSKKIVEQRLRRHQGRRDNLIIDPRA
jgi:hypothetical protein